MKLQYIPFNVNICIVGVAGQCLFIWLVTFPIVSGHIAIHRQSRHQHFYENTKTGSQETLNHSNPNEISLFITAFSAMQ